MIKSSTELNKLCIVMIGKNESKTLLENLNRYRCYFLKNPSTTLIYIDSNSEDSTLEIIGDFKKKYPDLPIASYVIHGDSNAAIARNAGIAYLPENTNYVFFLDADVIFEEKFICEAVSRLKANRELGTVTGLLIDVFTGNGQSEMWRDVSDAHPSTKLKKHGGNFIIRFDTLNQVGSFDESLVLHEDIDYCFRLRSGGYTLWRIDTLLGRHYTVSYLEAKRLKKELFTKKYFSSAKLFRKYIFSSFCLDMMVPLKAVLIRLFTLCCLIAGFFISYLWLVALAMFCFVLFRVKKQMNQSLFSRLLSFLIGIVFLAGLLYPVKQKASYRIVKV